MDDASTRRHLFGTVTRAGLLAALAGRLAAGGEPARADEETQPSARGAGGRKLLLLGGTQFLGPAIVDAALARGHVVTLFNRGRTNPHLYPDLEKLRGDRKNDLAALEGRSWDAVVDTSGYDPDHVRASAALLAPAVKHYVFVSTVSVYPGFGTSAETIDEDSSLGPLRERRAYERFEYGPFKALCEIEAERAMPGRVAAVRPGLIVGPGDPTDRFTWWPMRVHRGGEILAPGTPAGHCQFIDVRDLGAWIVHVVEQRITGTYNAVGFEGHLSMQELLHGCKCAIRTDCDFTWVSEAFLAARGIQPWTDLPLWLPAAKLPLVKAERARARGLVFRPVAQTVRDTLDWALANRPAGRLDERVGLTPTREREALAAWHADPQGR